MEWLHIRQMETLDLEIYMQIPQISLPQPLCPSLPSFLQMHKGVDGHILTFAVVEKKAGKNKRGMSNLYYISCIVGQFLQ